MLGQRRLRGFLPVFAGSPSVAARFQNVSVRGMTLGQPVCEAFSLKQAHGDAELFIGQLAMAGALVQQSQELVARAEREALIELLGQPDGLLDDHNAFPVPPRVELKLAKAAKSIVIKDARSPERLRDEINNVLWGTNGDSALVEETASNGEERSFPSLEGKKVLVVDDDVRNIFALTAMLERQKMEVASVFSGQEALDLLKERHDIDGALVDVMMPEMDGYVTMTEMRRLKSFSDRPIIALTAKAMKGDREKCIEAGASDYIAKPVNNTHLLSMLESWLVP